jgi:hypothetical protein
MARSRAAAAVTAFGLVLGLSLMGAVPASAQEVGETDTSAQSTGSSSGGVDEASATPDIVLRPDSGANPDDPGDRGGAYQGALFLAILAGVGGVGLFAWRDARRHRPA